MNEFLRKTAFVGALGLCVFAGATDAFAQSDQAASGRDLTVEAAPMHGRPWRRPFRPVQVSLMPVGPSTLAIGQPLRFRMVSLSDGYGQLYALSASGRSQLWMENVRLRAGQPVNYPRPGFIVRAAAPAGDETILFVATRAPISGFVGGASTKPFDLQFTHDGLRSAVQQQLDAMPRSDWAIGELTIRVQE